MILSFFFRAPPDGMFLPGACGVYIVPSQPSFSHRLYDATKIGSHSHVIHDSPACAFLVHTQL